MIKLNSTKRALLMSAIALILCISMLVGSTYAWFTDSVISSDNIIKSGTLLVSMEWADGAKDVPDKDSAEWTDASTGAIFKSDNWEPGFTEVYHIKIENEGALALKYKLNFAANGRVTELSDVIDVYCENPGVKIDSAAQLTNENKKGNLTQFLENIDSNISGTLAAGECHIITLALKMQESAGNEYQGLGIGHDFYLQLLAAQYNAESDSFGTQYDENAPYRQIIVSTAEELMNILKTTDEIVYIKLANDINFDTVEEVVLDKNLVYTIDLMGHTITFPGRAIKLNSGTMNLISSNGRGTIDRRNRESSDGRFITVGKHVSIVGNDHSIGCGNLDWSTLNIENIDLIGEVAPADGGGQLIHVICRSEVNIYNSSLKVMLGDNDTDMKYTNTIDVYNAAYQATVNLYEGASFYGDPTIQTYKVNDPANKYHNDWVGGYRHVFVAEGCEFDTQPAGYLEDPESRTEEDWQGWFTVVAKQ